MKLINQKEMDRFVKESLDLSKVEFVLVEILQGSEMRR
jgi:hypothetical protein